MSSEQLGSHSKPEFLITPRQSVLTAFLRELIRHRELLIFLTWKNIKVQFAQMVLGFGWLVLRPALNVLVLTVVFGKVAKLPSDGQPYALFAFSGVVVWNYFAHVTTTSSTSLLSNGGLLTKIYFPRIYLPMSVALGGLVDFAITLVLYMVFAAVVYARVPGAEILFLPLALALLMMTTLALGFWLSALAVDFRDVRYATAYMMQVLMFAAPVVWPISLLSQRFGASADWAIQLFAFYPMVGAIEGMRYALLGGDAPPWGFFLPGMVTALVLFLSGIWFFQRRERLMADKV